MSGMFGDVKPHSGHKSVEWYTPKWVFDELAIAFDLDPASPHDHESFVPASTKYTVFDDGLSKPWFGRVWLNPPYGRDTAYWMSRMADHGCGIALVFSRTDAAWFQESMKRCEAMLFLSGRVEFVPGHENKHKRSRSGAGTALFAYDRESAIALSRMAGKGVFLPGPGQARKQEAA